MLSFADTLASGLVLKSERLSKEIPSGVKLITSHTDSCDVCTINKKPRTTVKIHHS